MSVIGGGSDLAFRDRAATVWTGTHLLVWGGFAQPPYAGQYRALADGASFDPTTNTWTPLPPAPIEGGPASGVWASGRAAMVSQTGDAAMFDPATERWTELPPIRPAPRFGSSPRIAWSAGNLIVVGQTSTHVWSPAVGTWRVCGTAKLTGLRLGEYAIAFDESNVIAVLTDQTEAVVVARFDVENCRWSEPLRIPIRSDDVAAAIVDGQLIVATGSGLGHYLLRFESRNGEPTAWTYRREETPAERHASTAILTLAVTDASVVVDYGFLGIVAGREGQLRSLNQPQRVEDGTFRAPLHRFGWGSVTATDRSVLALVNLDGRIAVADFSSFFD